MGRRVKPVTLSLSSINSRKKYSVILIMYFNKFQLVLTIKSILVFLAFITSCRCDQAVIPRTYLRTK